ncbi:MAG: chlorite dismutase family protein [Thermoplasmata archaeon]
MTEAGGAAPPEPPRQFVKYTFYHLRPEWRRAPAAERARGRAELLRVLERPPDGMLLRTYSTVGTRAEVDFGLWMIAPELPALQEFHARVSGTLLGGYLDIGFSFLGMAKRSEYLGAQANPFPPEEEARRPRDLPFLFVYPFVKQRSWYALPFEERRRIMGEHLRIGRKFPRVTIHTGYSFGLDDMEFILSFETDAPSEFLDLVTALRPSEASRFTALETPILTCLRVEAARMLELAEGLP